MIQLVYIEMYRKMYTFSLWNVISHTENVHKSQF